MIEGDKVIDILNNFFVKCLCCKKKFEINKDCFDYSSSSVDLLQRNIQLNHHNHQSSLPTNL